MSDEAGDEIDNEVVRHIFRKRHTIVIGEIDRFEGDCLVFFADGRRYCIWRRFTQYGVTYTFYARPDHWAVRTHFRPAKHLMNTLWDVIDEIGREQEASRQRAVKAGIIGRAA